jgi:hypothetical protein
LKIRNKEQAAGEELGYIRNMDGNKEQAIWEDWVDWEQGIG